MKVSFAQLGCCVGWLLPWLGLVPAALGATDPSELPAPGTALERVMEGGAAHTYTFTTAQPRSLHLRVIQEGIDVALTLRSASPESTEGEEPQTFDSPNGRWGNEDLLLHAEPAIPYVLEIRSLEPEAMAATYRLRVEDLTGDDSQHHHRRAALEAQTRAGKLNAQGTREARRQALDSYGEAFEIWRALGDTTEQADALFHRALLHGHLGEWREALPRHRQALSLRQRLGDRRGEAHAWLEIGTAARVLGEGEAAQVAYEKALGLWHGLGDPHSEARTHNYLGLLWARRDPAKAIAPYREALRLFRATGDRRQVGVVLNNLGGIHDLLGEPHEALEQYRLALEIHQELDDLRQQAAVWNNMAAVYRRTNRLQDALHFFHRALEALRQLKDRRGEGRVLNNLGLTYFRLGDQDRAIAHLKAALELRRSTEDRRGEALTLSNLGHAHRGAGSHVSALSFYRQAMELYRTLDDSRGEGIALLGLGQTATLLGRTDQAGQHLEEALDLFGSVGSPLHQGVARTAFGVALHHAGDAQRATTELEQALEALRELGDGVEISRTLVALADVHRTLGHPRRAAQEGRGHLHRALRYSEEALQLLDGLRTGVDSLALRSSFLVQHQEAFETAVDIAMDLHPLEPTGGWAVRALELHERSRARSLLDLLEESGGGLRRGIDPELLTRQADLLERLHAKVDLQRQHLRRSGRDEGTERLDREILAITTSLEEVESTIRRQSPQWEALTHPRPFQARELQALLDPDTLLLEYALGEERSFVWAVSTEGVTCYELAPRRDIEAAAREVYEAFRVNDPRSRRATAQAAARLSDLLLGPLAHLPGPPGAGQQGAGQQGAGQRGATRLAIVADGALHYIPFAALPYPNPAPGTTPEPLLARYEVVALPSASALGLQRRILANRPAAPRQIAIFADPVFQPADPRVEPTAPAASHPPAVAAREGRLRDSLQRLAWSRWEAEAIVGHLDPGEATVALDFEANLDAIAAGLLRGHRILHFATHGFIDSEHPELSALVLSLRDAEGRPRPGYLRLPDILNLELDADLVVLSGCRTALGPEIRGEGLVSLARGFFAAGARRLVASLWRVQDRSTAELMDAFYRHLLAEGHSPAAALRAAQLELRALPGYQDPYHWAAFGVYGDWR